MLALALLLASAPALSQRVEFSLLAEAEAVPWGGVGVGERVYLAGAVGPGGAVRMVFHDALRIEASVGARANVGNVLLFPEVRAAELPLVLPLGQANLGAGWRFALSDDSTIDVGLAASASMSPELDSDSFGTRPSFGVSPQAVLRWRFVENFWFELRGSTPIDIWPSQNVHAVIGLGISWTSPVVQGTTRGEKLRLLTN